ncbi:MAG TPA: hypothetical protein VJ835_01275 [Fimbriimonadaceae bacterium]|nr:hypothetical protein [Fimbriimonadaceae bacterium]
MPTDQVDQTALEILRELEAFIDLAVKQNGGSTTAIRPSHRVKFHWPPHPVSYEYHVLASDWSGNAQFEAYGETFDVEVASTPYGFFGRCASIWHEDKGETLPVMLDNLRNSSEPLFRRQLTINSCLGQTGRFTGQLRSVGPAGLIKLLYCSDRDIANEAHTLIDTHASQRVFTPALVAILNDRRHPNRRSAQWCVLDLFEDLPRYCQHEEEEAAAITAIRDLIWDAEDDYARTIYKAGVVLGGHIPHKHGGPILIECLNAPSKFGRRSAIHGLFHVVEWLPELKEAVLLALKEVAAEDPEPILRDFAASMANDIEAGGIDHHPEPVFAEEL